ncbi:RidA family protein [Lentzea aerocolonigenes]|uniref:RidA family protein n=1 Tax=Lentzea aerocolonigenes TaxID=68170 RepID=UPI0004C30F52|nr:RidA family protein [Lentzea aerocolonigenes]MCP2245463.1 Enamine deaminase RidA, house cleaning of reactive enamine intermediates, YjgF/YER057c/UK114 family [Lentzea aerocolonigenes]
MITFIDPDELPKIDVYHQVAVASGSRTVYVAGQVAWDAAPDLATQTAQAYENVHIALKAAGATLHDLVKVTVYVVDWTPDKMPQLLDGIARVTQGQAPPATLIGVAALDVPEHLVEIEAVAVID